MELSIEMARALDQRFKCNLTNIPVLEKPVLVVFDFSPADDMPPLSIAFDWAGGPKCWLSERRLVEIEEKCPSYHPKYKKFNLEGREFHPFSIKAFPKTIFEEIDAFSLACRSLYDHVVWG